MRDWNIDEIMNSNISNEMKEVLTQEFNKNELSEHDPNNFTKRIITLKDLKKEFFLTEITLLENLKDYYLEAKELYKKYKYDATIRYQFLETDITEEGLIEYTLNFYKSLEDKEILEVIKRLFAKDSNALRIQKYSNDNPICNEVRGRCIKSFTTNDVFLSYYMTGTSEDLQIFTHETGHMLSHALFGKNINKLVINFLSETESYLFESLMNSYIANDLNLPDLALHLEANRTAKIIDIIWSIRVLEHLYHQIGTKPNMNRLNRKLKKDGLIVNYGTEDFKDIATFKSFELNSILFSYLIALHFYKLILSDKEKGLYLFKEFMKSPIKDPLELFYTFNIEKNEVLNNLDIMYQKAVTLKRRDTEL